MRDLSSEIKVGLFALVGVAVFVMFYLKTRDAPFGPGGAYSLYTVVPSAEGVQLGSIVSMAGVQVGRVGRIQLTPDGKAQVELQLRKDFALPADSTATVKTMGILGDRTVHLLVGTSDLVLEPGASVPYATLPGDIDALTGQLSAITDDVKAVTSDLTVVSESVKTLMSGSELTAGIDRVVKNLEVFTASLNNLEQGNKDELAEIIRNFRNVSQSLKGMLEQGEDALSSGSQGVTEQLNSLKEATTRLNDLLGKVDRIAQKVEQGEGTVGALLNDRSTVDALNDTIEGANEIIEKVNRYRTTVTYRGDVYATGGTYGYRSIEGSAKHTVDIQLAGRKDYYYVIGLVSDPHLDAEERWVVTDGDPSTLTTSNIYSDSFQLTFQFARRWKDLTLRFGVRENHGGAGADYAFLNDRASFSLDVFDFSANQRFPNVELRGRYDFYDHLYFSAGLDDTLNRLQAGGTNLFIGGGFTFRDDDLKYIMTFLPMP